MDTPLADVKPINAKVFDAIYTSCCTTVEFMPQSQAILKERDELIAQLEGKVPSRVIGKLDDLVMTAATQWGYEMFKLGIAIARNPDKIFDLPDVGW